MSSLEHTLFNTIAEKAWKKVGVTHHHGIAIPLISIRTKSSSGNGEFYDLFPLIDYCANIGMDIIQLLPLNDSDEDPSPYNALSSCALHPIYLSLNKLPYLTDALKQDLHLLEKFNHTKRIDYQALLSAKKLWLKKYLYVAEDKIKNEKKYSEFCAKNQWLKEYALFKTLKEKHHGKHWKDWEPHLSTPSKSELKRLERAESKNMEAYFLEQYLCFKQLKEVKAYGTKKGVFLKGDIPILVSPNSADVWFHREFFDLTHVAGSPPNIFNPEGQYWGFPIYHWKAMEENHYEWWKTRLNVAKDLYDIYRIDHIMGLFRIWAIPPEQSPIDGSYIPSDLALMEAQGRSLLETFVHATDMLPIGEDLGNTPLFARECLSKLGVSGTRVLRWERDWEGNSTWLPLDSYSPASLSTVSTHDLTTLTLWWKESPEEASAYAKEKGWEYGRTPTEEQLYAILYDSHHTSSLFHINLLQEYLALTPELTWENPEDERINYPGTVQECNWTYCYKEPLEVLLTHQKLQENLKSML